MIEELDSTALTHGKLLFPFQFVRRYLAVRMPRQVQKAGKETTLLPKEHTRPISTRVRSLPAKRSHCRGARLQSARAIYLCALPKSMRLMDVGIGQRDAVERCGREVKMRSEVFWCRRHRGRSP